MRATLVGACVIAAAACTNNLGVGGGLVHSPAIGSGTQANLQIGIGTTATPNAGLIVNTNIGGGISHGEGFSLYRTASAGLDFIRQPKAERGLGFRVGMHVVDLAVRKDVDYFGPSVRVAVFPRTKRDSDESYHPHNFSRNYYQYSNVGVELRFDFLRPDRPEGELFRDDDSWMITLNAVAELTSLHK